MSGGIAIEGEAVIGSIYWGVRDCSSEKIITAHRTPINTSPRLSQHLMGNGCSVECFTVNMVNSPLTGFL